MQRYIISLPSLLQARRYAQKCKLKPNQWIYLSETERIRSDQTYIREGIRSRSGSKAQLLGTFTEAEIAHFIRQDVKEALTKKYEEVAKTKIKEE